jgi:hypothetical protein
MPKRLAYNVRLRRQETGEEHDRLIFAQDEATAKERAVVRARASLGSTMAERKYGQFEVLSCTPAALEG